MSYGRGEENSEKRAGRKTLTRKRKSKDNEKTDEERAKISKRAKN
jgi:hypothetical protein